MQNDWIAIWGAVLSTGLALLRLWELYRNHFRVDTAYNLTSSEIEGNEIYIRNLNNRPITIEHWELQWRDRRWSKADTIRIAQDFSAGRKIDAYGSMTLRFEQDDYFSTKPISDGKKLYIKLYFVGKKRPVLKRVY